MLGKSSATPIRNGFSSPLFVPGTTWPSSHRAAVKYPKRLILLPSDNALLIRHLITNQRIAFVF